MVHKLKKLKRNDNPKMLGIDEEWIDARPINYKHRSFSEKVKECYLLWIGETESFKWDGGQ